jgi:hypothetical protein
MALSGFGRGAAAAAMAIIAATLVPAGGAQAYLYWNRPDFAGPPVRGDEPGIALPLPGASPAEIQANLVWTLRAGLNVAALQCQFAPPLMTVRNYNDLLGQHGKELVTAYTALGNYFKRTGGKAWQRAFDAHTTRTYNGFSTMHAQLGFCETAGAIGRHVLEQPKGKMIAAAQQRLRELRNSLVPRGDTLFSYRPISYRVALPPLDDRCWKKGALRKICGGAA